ncbi:hypothetical protein C0J52_19266, partial [Blattella germanica]
ALQNIYLRLHVRWTNTICSRIAPWLQRIQSGNGRMKEEGEGRMHACLNRRMYWQSSGEGNGISTSVACCTRMRVCAPRRMKLL